MVKYKYDIDTFMGFIKQLLYELKQNIWGKWIISVGIVFIIGNILIKTFEISRTLDLLFNIPLIILWGYSLD